MGAIKDRLRILRNNFLYLWRTDLYDREKERTYELTDKIVEDVIYEFDEDKKILKNLDILDADESIDLLLTKPKSMCRFGDGEISIIKGMDQDFQKYDQELARRLSEIMMKPQPDMYIGINRAYFHSPINCSAQNRRFYRIYSTEYRRFFLNICNENNTYIDAGFLTAYYRFDDAYDYEQHYQKRRKLIEGRKIALVCGKGILDHLTFNIFDLASEVIKIDAPARHAFESYDQILKEVMEKVPKDYIVCIILGMTAKVLVVDLTAMGYVAWDLGHFAKDYDAYMTKAEKSKENMKKFWDPD